MNFNKTYALFCGICSLTIFITYFVNYYDVYESYTSELQYLVIGVSTLAFLGSLVVLFKKAKILFSKSYIYTTIVLLIISLLAMWFNQFLYVRI